MGLSRLELKQSWRELHHLMQLATMKIPGLERIFSSSSLSLSTVALDPCMLVQVRAVIYRRKLMRKRPGYMDFKFKVFCLQLILAGGCNEASTVTTLPIYSTRGSSSGCRSCRVPGTPRVVATGPTNHMCQFIQIDGIPLVSPTTATTTRPIRK